MLEPTKDATSSLPCLIQGSDNPVFRCRDPVAEQFVCGSCGHTLIDGYLPANFIAVRIRCFRCSEISETPGLSPGEIVPGQLVTLGETGNYLIGGTVDYERSVAMTIDAQIARSNSECTPRRSQDKWQFDEGMLEELERGFECSTGLSFQTLIPKLERHRRASVGAAMEATPFVWALQHLRAAHSRKFINLDDALINTALTRAMMFGQMIRAWKHHPRFEAIAKEVSHPASFNHTTGLFAFAEYLFDAGNRIAFSVENVDGKPKPDLYFRPSVDQRLFVEFKAPKVLTWNPDTNLTSLAVEKKVRELLGTSRQINRRNPGVIAIMVNHPHPGVARSALAASMKFLKNCGRRRGSLAAVCIMNCAGVTRVGPSIGINCEVEVGLNEFWEHGDNPVFTTKKA